MEVINTMIHTNNIFLKPLFVILCFSLHGLNAQTDTITSSLSITDPDSIISGGHVFKLGFFSPENSTDRYLAIYYVVSETTPIWVANRDNPLTDNSGTVTISDDGNLILINGRNETIWSTNASTSAPVNTTAQLQDTGNLILRDISTGEVLWDFFSHPTNTFMPGMRIYENTRVSSWKSPSDPGLGNFTAEIRVALSIVQVFIWENGRLHYRSGPWNGNIFIGVKEMYSAYQAGFRVGNDSGNIYVTSPEVSFLTKSDLDLSGSITQTLWDERTRRWQVTWSTVQNECDVYGKCGPFGICNPMDSPICSCLSGFEPADRDEWGSRNWTSGCIRRTELQCRGDQSGNEFLRIPNVKVPDLATPFQGGVEDECRIRCLRNCSCLAYSHNTNIGCMLWMETLVDIQQFDGVGADLHIRLASSEFDTNNERNLVVIIIPVVVGFAFLSICIFMAWYWMAKKKGKRIEEQSALEILPSDPNDIVLKDESEKINVPELPLFTVKTLADATNQFHEDNMLGTGGFGHVYKGTLANGKDIAVKRLSINSGQGAEEFKNEAILISKVQHRNLVKLHGYCIEREEKMLVYEYMPNSSLDACLFDPMHPSHKILDWKKRFSIVEGIGRGLLYLHMDSRLKIIHRDLKPSNVLLDDDYDPKISDFGIARIFGGNQEQDNTTRVVGTYGYMAPEYAMDGTFSEKSDVYSFGVLMLEIVSGKKNTHYYNQEWSLSLLGCAWKLWNGGNGMEFSDQTIANLSFEAEIVRCIHIALLCVQEFPKDRPAVQTLLSMLNCEIDELPLPEQPVFAEKWNHSHVESSQPTRQTGCSINELTITLLDGR